MKFKYILGATILACAPLLTSAQTSPNSSKDEGQEVHSSKATLQSEQDDLENYRDHKQNFEQAVEENDMGAAKTAHAQIIADMRQELTQDRAKVKAAGSTEKATDIKKQRQRLLDRQEEVMNKFASLQISGAANQEGQLNSMIDLLNEYEGYMEQQIGLIKKEIRMDVKEVEKK